MCKIDLEIKTTCRQRPQFSGPKDSLIIQVSLYVFFFRFEHSDCKLDGKRVGENIACSWSSVGADYTGTVKTTCDSLRLYFLLCL